MYAKPRQDYSLPEQAKQPPVMAIGDSLFNGMRSATINAELARLSAPALVARALSEEDDFVAPKYPDHVLLDLEAEMRKLDFPFGVLPWLDGLKKRVRLNARAWLDGEHTLARPVQFDNLAIAGAETEHLFARKLKDVKADLAKWKTVIDKVDDPLDWPGRGVDLMGLHMAINTRFLLDPAETDFFDEMTPIDFVEWRQPYRLLVNIGPNHGLIDLTEGGAWDPRDDGGHNRLAELPRKIEEFAPYLKNLSRGVRHIYFSNLPKPSAVPNLMPVDHGTHSADVRHGVLFDKYENRLGGLHDYRVYSKSEMRDINKFVASINDKVVDVLERIFGADGRLHIFDFHAAFSQYDYKHFPRKALRLQPPDTRHPNRTYGNNAFHVGAFLGRSFWPGGQAGGLGSLDNHHPSTLGYTVMARHLLDTILDAEAGDPPGEGAIERRPLVIGDREDSLLNDLPVGWAEAPWTLLNVRRALQGRGDASPEEETHARAVDAARRLAPVR
jgi:hypothetical protein